MTASQSAQINMMRVVENICDAHTAAWTGFPVFVSAKTQFSANLLAITAAIGLQSEGTKGATAQKGIYRKAMESDLLQLAAAVQLYYRFSGNATEAREATLTSSGIDKMNDNELLGLTVRIKDMAGDIGAAGLLSYGVDGAFLAAFPPTINRYSNSIDNPRRARRERAKSTAAIARLIKESTTLLEKQMDVAMVLLQATQPAFYTEYKAGRRIKDAGHRPRTLTVRVVDGATGEPLAGVAATLKPGKMKRETSRAGRFYVQTLATGTYTLALVREGYVSHTEELQVEKGGRAELVVQMTAE